jgi:hypothetical protein
MGHSVVTALGIAALISLTSALSNAQEVVVQPPNAAGSGQPAEVTVQSTGEAVTIAKVTDRMAATGYGVGGTVTVLGVAWKDLCMSPCTFKIDPGMHELMVYGPGVTGTSEKFDLRSGKHQLQVKPGSSALSTGGTWVFALGLAAFVTGATFLIIDADEYGWALPVTIGGAAGTGGGLAMMMLGRTSFEQVGSPTARASERAFARRTPAVGYRAQF